MVGSSLIESNQAVPMSQRLCWKCQWKEYGRKRVRGVERSEELAEKSITRRPSSRKCLLTYRQCVNKPNKVPSSALPSSTLSPFLQISTALLSRLGRGGEGNRECINGLYILRTQKT
uniref:Uncharacterized protein n=1 Tax=Vespula pensylvanica TaxID=30213 RepID=A0A834UGW6_VESPE|nr:hypothetical protein H0235_001552 [Vespula pensylvanica]